MEPTIKSIKNNDEHARYEVESSHEAEINADVEGSVSVPWVIAIAMLSLLVGFMFGRMNTMFPYCKERLYSFSSDHQQIKVVRHNPSDDQMDGEILQGSIETDDLVQETNALVDELPETNEQKSNNTPNRSSTFGSKTL